MSETKRYDEIQRADMAKMILSSPVMEDALDAIEKDVLNAWENTSARDTEGREKAWAFYLAARKFRSTLKSYIETGMLARVQLEEKKRFNLFRSN
jgi:hypothetical protein